ncbi:hypothetical protein EV368DRAFT_87552 [Lentinula lateritia]|nr:hypothetical protein EV368DRAFT_87552 [Lentinula lateritia]
MPLEIYPSGLHVDLSVDVNLSLTLAVVAMEHPAAPGGNLDDPVRAEGLDVMSKLLPDLEPEELVLEEDDLEMLADMLEDLDLWDPADGPMDFGQESDSEVEELQGEELVRSLEEKEARTESAFEVLMKERLVKEWGRAENSSRMGVYNGCSDRTERYHAQKVVEKKKKDAAMRNTNTAKAFTSFFIPIQKAVVVAPESIPRTCTPESDPTPTLPNPSPMFSVTGNSECPELEGFLSDTEEDPGDDFDLSEGDKTATADYRCGINEQSASLVGPPRKHQKRAERAEASAKYQQTRDNQLTSALKDIEKLLASKKDSFVNGHDGLQATRARSIRSTLTMVVEKKKGLIDASHIAAEANNFSLNWGSHCIRQWTQNWIKTRVLPQSSRGRHTKVYSLLSEPAARDAIRGYLRTNKWSVNPPRLKKLFANELAPDEAREYAKQIISQEMPRGLKGFVEEHLLPRMQCRPGCFGLSLSSMRQLMLREGFVFIEHKKAVYFDGHERPDVVQDRQTRFIPQANIFHHQFVRYDTKDVTKEMVTQAHDGQKKGWVLEGEQPLKKKGPGRGIHQSDFICSTVGWLKDASVTLEYGKNHEGYWNCELFIHQLKEKFFPAFRAAHGPNYIAVVLVDNSQGHAAYAKDALRASEMGFQPGGKQCRMQQVLMERGLWKAKLLMKCKGDCPDDAIDCCARRVLSLQPDFQEQISLVQEVIEAAGHLCLFLPKFHCEINFIEYFWGAVKHYLREHCDYTFKTLRENMLKALASIQVELIRKWEHRAWRFIDAYGEGLGAKDAVTKVKQFSSRRYTSHRWIPESLAQAMDQ